jgi:flagellin
MVEISNMMQRMRELAVQSANDTNTPDDREYLNLEFQQLKEEANRITKNTQWNGTKILDGSFQGNGADNKGQFKFQVGANANQTIDHTIDQLSFSAVTTDAGAAIESEIASGVQTTTVTITSEADYSDPTAILEDWKEGDVISLKLGSDQLQYTIAKDDLAGDNDEVLANITAGITAAFAAAKEDGRFAGITATATDDIVEFVGDADITFDTGASASSGRLASVDGLEIKTLGNSNTAITGLDSAMKNINSARAEIGSIINRLTYAADNLTNVSQNTSASRSQVMDTDYAQATTELARTQIISQAATAMLAQANQAPQSVLSLLR